MKSNNILKNTLKFMASFIVLTIITAIIFGLMVAINPGSVSLYEYVPIKKNFNSMDLDWDKINRIGGYGLLIDEDGKVIKSYNSKESKEEYSSGELLDMMSSNKGITDVLKKNKDEKTTLLYNVENGHRLLLVYPADVIYNTVNVDMNKTMGKRANLFLVYILITLILYISSLFYLIRRLSKSLNKDLEKIKRAEEERKDELFRGLAHDVKTPLSTILAFSNALSDGLVSGEDEHKYYEGIQKNGRILSDRINDMLNLSVLSEEGMYNPKSEDILEFIRRYVGDNYIWYSENNAVISIEFEENEKYITDFDPKLFERILQNLLQNSVYHNKGSVKITIGFDYKNKKLIFKDNGIGIPEDLVEKIFEPMITGDASRTGEKLRGMGLANVKRIADLHGWEILYNNGFVIIVE